MIKKEVYHISTILLYQNHKHQDKKRFCRSGCGYENTPGLADTPGFAIQTEDSIMDDPRGFKKLCLKRNNKRLTQTSLYCLQAWRGNCDIQLLIYDTDPCNPDPAEIAKVTDYVVGYACKGNQTLTVEKSHVKSFTLR